jgi:hypothetical protein
VLTEGLESDSAERRAGSRPDDCGHNCTESQEAYNGNRVLLSGGRLWIDEGSRNGSV